MANDKKKGLDTNGNIYTIVYAAVMVVIVAFLLAFISSALKPKQDANVENDTKGQILAALGFDRKAVDVQKTFAENVTDKVLNNGQLEDYDGPFLSSYGTALKNGDLHVFVAKTATGEDAYVLPVVGRGLWGGLWGYIALDATKTKVLGTYFYHESETAGLGARIGDRDFQEKFIGKPVCDAEGNVALTVVKDGAAKQDYEVNGVTGATLTSKGVGAMCTEGLAVYYLAGFAAQCEQPCQQTECDTTEVEQN
ncbi:MAG: FMN-binding protein [Bacteroidaceae bacterium]|jgi:Na+-transporting NADH:ubiquinone oxidoreductase subunit C|nr:FMN-binding protein [Bacteroidaceae bacterium]MBQ3908207.1 FMN-binding protein [Bacteroidaceae bacterium]